MSKINLIIIKLCTIVCLSSCVTPSQRDAMQRDIQHLNEQLLALNKNLNVQTRQTERNMQTTLSSQSEVQQLQTSIAENAGDIDLLKMKIQKIEQIGAESFENYRTTVELQGKTIEKLERQIAYLKLQNQNIEKKVYPSEKLKASFNPKTVNELNKILKQDYEKGWYKNVVLKSSMIIQSDTSKKDMIESALEFRGEARYRLEQYSDAIVDLTQYVQNYPKGSKNARALLLLGDSYVFLKENAAAKFYYAECAEKFGKTSEGKACLERLSM